ncbi:MAG: sulfotransferase family protein [Polymorphobacter sp.]
MSLQIIGAGLGRTGTKTLQTALVALGFGPCHHMTEVFDNPEQMAFWFRAVQGEAVEWDDIFAPYRASVDWPSAHFYKQLADRYPHAKVILSKRDSGRWADSMAETILKAMAQLASIPRDSPDDPRQFSQFIVARDTFGYDFSRANVIAAFERHNAEVVRVIAPERLLVFDPAQGWAPLCAFLNVAVPDTEFPRTNSREEFWSRIMTMNAAAEGMPKRD